MHPDVVRSLVGLVLLVIGVITLIALALPGEGTLTTWWRDFFAPWFGTGRWALPFLLLAAGVYVEFYAGRAGSSGSRWGTILVCLTVIYIAALALLDLADLPDRSGGRIGAFVGDLLASLVGPLGATVILMAVIAGGILIIVNRSLGSVVGPAWERAKAFGGSLQASMRSEDPGAAAPGSPDSRKGATKAAAGAGAVSTAGSPGQAAVWGPDGEASRSGAIPVAVPSVGPVSSTFAPAAPTVRPDSPAPMPPAVAAALPPRHPDDVTEAGDAPPAVDEPPYALPPLTLLEDIVMPAGGASMDHERNAAIIVGKLSSFNIPARVIRWNAGPVVTQYEVEPDPSIKVSRIEGLSDDLSMALAARTIRIEAPIPGKSVVGIEIPNVDFNVVALRRILEEVDFEGSGSRLTFALGRDVAGHARAADLAKMPHLLIAGATGSGKSVMVNALIASLLMHATPDDVRLILMDLKRVELASYNELPHLLVPVITETERAKAALKWTVMEMESRYRRFAGASARNIATYNETRVDPADRLPFIVIIIDELADLMMREGKNVEDPIVRLAQKARATGIHLVLATQRPSVNVVTGLIKANFPSRIAFAMASQIDSRTILDSPGAEDLIGRGDMLFQPADLPRPMRLQGVFVSDKEIRAITEYWRSWDHHYDLGIVASDEADAAAGDDLVDDDADRLLPDAVEVIREYDRASASLLQRRLRIGYARAARIIDQLEARGYVGPFDGSNARQVLRRDETPAAIDALEDDRP
ncbi:MAG TPA: DNA translocase FtsK 4TM domain-containing protein [Candidatus Limnocylindrales bacterium]|nr:DNA translocase FtsK 4TM domain-containing protein [Candidatus Limnocylindrales bacterium]